MTTEPLAQPRDPEHARTTPRGDERAPDKPRHLAKGSRKAALKRSAKGFKRDELADRAAALTYYMVLSIFPMLIALVSLLGLLPSSVTQSVIDNITDMASGTTRDVVVTAIENVQGSGGAATASFIVSLAIAVWSASKYVAAFMRSANVLYEMDEGRPFVRKSLVRVGVTLVLLVLMVAIAVGVFASGSLADQLGEAIGLSSEAVTVWGIAKWPVMILLIALLLAVLYRASPNVRQPGIRWSLPGGLVAIVIWIVASVGFALFVANFGSFNQTYGSMAGIIIFLIWLWITNLAIVLGAELNAELQRSREIEAGHPEHEEPFLAPRDTRKMDQTMSSS